MIHTKLTQSACGIQRITNLHYGRYMHENTVCIERTLPQFTFVLWVHSRALLTLEGL